MPTCSSTRDTARSAGRIPAAAARRSRTSSPAASRSSSSTSALAPQLAARKPRALGQRLEFRPHDRGVNAAVEGALRESAVGARHDALAADEVREAQDALCYELGVLHHVGGVADEAGSERLAL